MKKILFLLFVLLILIEISACGKEKTVEPESFRTDVTSEEVEGLGVADMNKGKTVHGSIETDF